MTKGDVLVIKRLESDEVETLGLISVIRDGEVLCTTHSLELPWRDNQRNISCIPTGSYTGRVLDTEAELSTTRFDYKCIAIDNVPERSGIKIHIANYVHQIRGCIIPGKGRRDIDNDGIIDMIGSAQALDKIIQNLPQDKPFDIYIIDETGKA